MKSILQPNGRLPRSVLVTGAAGFIGSRACAALRHLEVKVIALDNLLVGLPLPKPDALTVPIEGDIRDRALLDEIFSIHRPEAALHLAAVHHIPTCEREPMLAFDVNVMGTQCVLQAIERSDSCLGLAMASSGAVYRFSEDRLDEATSPLKASDVYSTTKLTNEYQLQTWAQRQGRRAHVARLFNTIGPNDPNAHLIPDVLRQIEAAGEGPVRIALGNSAPRRDYIFVEDAAAGFLQILFGLGQGEAFEAYNLCRGEEMSVAELVAVIGEALGRDILIDVDPARFRKVDRISQLGSVEKTAARFNWRARTSVPEAIDQILLSCGFSLKGVRGELAGHEGSSHADRAGT